MSDSCADPNAPSSTPSVPSSAVAAPPKLGLDCDCSLLKTEGDFEFMVACLDDWTGGARWINGAQMPHVKISRRKFEQSKLGSFPTTPYDYPQSPGHPYFYPPQAPIYVFPQQPLDPWGGFPPLGVQPQAAQYYVQDPNVFGYYEAPYSPPPAEKSYMVSYHPQLPPEFVPGRPWGQ
ncbi:hypothetical protein CYLTODRAFT_419627 [Cylindrobasidium torrendii FP15055 ss-10]|uniref:Uncharacterized protein n=1 Tax=Cylindrobasidium torrendii FP15055 ss-10 TaxID=1314674 RepID=A0A0D7BK93_9AGAR|nr:hypothetical protein CYLTODRAFT_419627 [Cylindrobasidium torrendii FP15055 ss-10]